MSGLRQRISDWLDRRFPAQPAPPVPPSGIVTVGVLKRVLRALPEQTIVYSGVCSTCDQALLTFGQIELQCPACESRNRLGPLKVRPEPPPNVAVPR